MANTIGVSHPPEASYPDKVLSHVFARKNPNDDDIFLGLSGVSFEVDEFDFGHGIRLTRTYAHIFAPFMAAFERPHGKGQPHGGPWKVVNGGLACDVGYQLYIPIEFAKDEWFDRLNTAWWFLSLLRLKCSSLLLGPVTSNFDFSLIGVHNLDAVFHPIEFNSDVLPIDDDRDKIVTREDLEWVKAKWSSAGILFRNNENFADAFVSADRCLHEQRPSTSTVIIWGALERLFADFKQELNFRVALNIASYLEHVGPDRLNLFATAKKLYGARSKAAHGRRHEDYEAYKQSYILLRRSLIAMIEADAVPNASDLERYVLEGR